MFKQITGEIKWSYLPLPLIQLLLLRLLLRTRLLLQFLLRRTRLLLSLLLDSH
jgi:hypothetical protein